MRDPVAATAPSRDKKSSETEASDSNLINLKVSTLIDLTLGFHEGLQLWTDEVIDTFVHARYEQIGPDRMTSRLLMRGLVMSDRESAADPRFAPLLDLPGSRIAPPVDYLKSVDATKLNFLKKTVRGLK